MITNNKRSKLGAILAVIAGVGCAAPAAKAATVFTANDANASIFNVLANTIGDTSISVDRVNFFSNGLVRVSFLNQLNLASRRFGVNPSFISFDDLSLGFFGSSNDDGVFGGSGNLLLFDLDQDDVTDGIGNFNLVLDEDGIPVDLILIAVAADASLNQSLELDIGESTIAELVVVINSVPEPSSVGLLSVGFLGLLGFRRRGNRGRSLNLESQYG